MLILSAHRGLAGTRVRVVAKNCPHPLGQPDEFTWHDRYQLVHKNSANPPYWRIRTLKRIGSRPIVRVKAFGRSSAWLSS